MVRSIWPGILIAGNMGVLFICERYMGLPFGGLHESLGWLVSLMCHDYRRQVLEGYTGAEEQMKAIEQTRQA